MRVHVRSLLLVGVLVLVLVLGSGGSRTLVHPVKCGGAGVCLAKRLLLALLRVRLLLLLLLLRRHLLLLIQLGLLLPVLEVLFRLAQLVLLLLLVLVVLLLLLVTLLRLRLRLLHRDRLAEAVSLCHRRRTRRLLRPLCVHARRPRLRRLLRQVRRRARCLQHRVLQRTRVTWWVETRNTCVVARGLSIPARSPSASGCLRQRSCGRNGPRWQTAQSALIPNTPRQALLQLTRRTMPVFFINSYFHSSSTMKGRWKCGWTYRGSSRNRLRPTTSAVDQQRRRQGARGEMRRHKQLVRQHQAPGRRICRPV